MQLAIHLPRVDGQFTAHFDLAFATHHAFEHDVVSVGVDVQVVANAHGLHQKAQLCGQFFAHAFDTAHQFAAGFNIHQRNQTVANFQANQVHLIDVVPIQIFGGLGGGSSLRLGHLHRFIIDFASNHQQTQASGHRRQGDEHQVGHARDQAQSRQDDGGDKQSCWIGQLGMGLLGD